VIDSAALLKDLKVQLKLLQTDLRERAEDSADAWGARLKEEYAEARRRERTGHSWVVWRENEVNQAAVAWLVATTFLRFCEDNDLLAGAHLDGRPTPVGWIAGPGDRTQRAEENLTAYFRTNPTHNRRNWLQHGFRVLAAQPAGNALVDPQHNSVWTALISPESAAALIDFWRRTDKAGALVHDFTDADLGTRFLGDLYQDLSEHAKKTYALLQTPVFVEEFILDQTLTPALKEFGLDGLKLIDPTCGSGHFLLGAFERLEQKWREAAPALDAKERVRRAMNSIHGVDLNPFAVAIARFRLTVAGLKVAGERSLAGVAPLPFHLAIGDSLLGEFGGAPDEARDLFEEGEKKETYLYDAEDLKEYTGILQPGQYHVIVGNPPYITVKDKALNALYRRTYKTAAGKYALSAPFMELFFRLSIRSEQGRSAGYVGKITSNSFMKRDFGRKLIEDFFGGHHLSNPVDLTHVIDSAGAWMPGHNFDGTPTVILFGRRRRPVAESVRVVLGVKDDPGKPDDPAHGPVWTEIVDHLENPAYEGEYVSVADLDRVVLTSHPWSLSGGGAGALMAAIDSAAAGLLKERVERIGFFGVTGIDEAFEVPPALSIRLGAPVGFQRLVVGDEVRDFGISVGDFAFFPYDGAHELQPLDGFSEAARRLWPLRAELGNRATFSKQTYFAEGRPWYEWHQLPKDVGAHGWSITFAFVATHNHFVLNRGGEAFNHSAPVIKLGEGVSEEQHLELLGVLNSSTACFWLKQVSQKKGGDADVPWLRTWEFTGTRLQRFPLPAELPLGSGRALDTLGQELGKSSQPAAIKAWLEHEPNNAQNLGQRLKEDEGNWDRTRKRMIFEQEELDWEVYRLYGLLDDDYTYSGDALDQLSLGQRAFEIALARRVEAGAEKTAWFSRRGSTPITELPLEWPADYAELVQCRLALIEADPSIGLLERPDFKRRWETTWADQLAVSIKAAILDRLEQPLLWHDEQGPVTRSVAELADLLRADSTLRELAAVLTGSAEPDLATVLGSLVAEEAVPYLAAHRYKPSGLEKFRTWQDVWALQRREDAGEKVDIAVPPKYGQADFRKPTFSKARGKLDVPKERFILYPDLRREGEKTPVLGWAGWDHRDQALALGRELPVQEILGADDDALTPLLAGLVELEPWLHQWHQDDDPTFGASPAAVISQLIDQYLLRMEKTREQVTAWTPPAATRGRRSTRS